MCHWFVYGLETLNYWVQHNGSIQHQSASSIWHNMPNKLPPSFFFVSKSLSAGPGHVHTWVGRLWCFCCSKQEKKVQITVSTKVVINVLLSLKSFLEFRILVFKHFFLCCCFFVSFFWIFLKFMNSFRIKFNLNFLFYSTAVKCFLYWQDMLHNIFFFKTNFIATVLCFKKNRISVGQTKKNCLKFYLKYF